jgi:hypothetical protein
MKKMSDYQEKELKAPFELALNELVKKFLAEGTPLEEIAVALEEAALRAGDEEEGEDGEWRSRVP